LASDLLFFFFFPPPTFLDCFKAGELHWTFPRTPPHPTLCPPPISLPPGGNINVNFRPSSLQVFPPFVLACAPRGFFSSWRLRYFSDPHPLQIFFRPPWLSLRCAETFHRRGGSRFPPPPRPSVSTPSAGARHCILGRGPPSSPTLSPTGAFSRPRLAKW